MNKWRIHGNGQWGRPERAWRGRMAEMTKRTQVETLEPDRPASDREGRARKAYRSPTLSYVGTVRELTLGANTTPAVDAGTSKKPGL